MDSFWDCTGSAALLGVQLNVHVGRPPKLPAPRPGAAPAKPCRAAVAEPPIGPRSAAKRLSDAASRPALRAAVLPSLDPAQPRPLRPLPGPACHPQHPMFGTCRPRPPSPGDSASLRRAVVSELGLGQPDLPRGAIVPQRGTCFFPQNPKVQLQIAKTPGALLHINDAHPEGPAPQRLPKRRRLLEAPAGLPSTHSQAALAAHVKRPVVKKDLKLKPKHQDIKLKLPRVALAAPAVARPISSALWPMCITYGSDCSGMGTDSLAMRRILGDRAQHVFACDSSKAARHVVLRNFRPRHWFEDVRCPKRLLAKLKVDVYTAGRCQQ